MLKTLKSALGLFCIVIFLFGCKSSKNDVVFEDFETERFSKWQIQGTSFNHPCRADSVANEALSNSVKGRRFAYSHLNDKRLNQGKLISPQFRINHKYIDFLIGGGQHPTRTCINLLIDNQIVRTESGDGNFLLSPSSWDVSEFMGKMAIIEIVDAQYSDPNDLPFVMVDQIVFSNHVPRTDIIFEDFESGNFKHWMVQGNAYVKPGSRENIYYPVTVNGFKGQHFAFSFGKNHDKEQGSLISKPFTVSRNYISFLIGGGKHPDTTCMRLVVNDSIIFSETGRNTGTLRSVYWDVSSLIGKTAKIEILDNYSGGWGHIIVDDIRFVDDPFATNVNEAYYYQPAWPTYQLLTVLFSIAFVIVVALLYYFYRKHTNSGTPVLKNRSFKKQLLSMLENEEIFRSKDLQLQQVAQRFDMTTPTFQTKTQKVFKKPFSELVNQYRVDCFKTEVLKKENKELKLVAVALKCGFNSKSSFYRIFKKYTKLTPTDYMTFIAKGQRI